MSFNCWNLLYTQQLFKLKCHHVNWPDINTSMSAGSFIYWCIEPHTQIHRAVTVMSLCLLQVNYVDRTLEGTKQTISQMRDLDFSLTWPKKMITMKICTPCFQQCGLRDNAGSLNRDRKFSHPLSYIQHIVELTAQKLCRIWRAGLWLTDRHDVWAMGPAVGLRGQSEWFHKPNRG
jgi:hypothetical protein